MRTRIKFLRRKVKDSQGLYPIILRVTKNRRSKIFTLSYKVTEDQWDSTKEKFTNKATNFIRKNKRLNQLEAIVLDILQEFEDQGLDFTLQQLERKLRNSSSSMTVDTYLENHIQRLEGLGKYGPAEPYHNLKSALNKFWKEPLQFQEINTSWLKEFELFLAKAGNTDGGIAFKMRHLRVIFNNAINEDLIDVKHYPFRKYKISRLKGSNRKIALSENELRAFEGLQLTNQPHLVYANKYFMFSFYCRGINWEDMMRLKKNDIYDGRIHYQRRKTKRPFVIEILPPVQEIIDYFKNENINSSYVFPIILNEDLTPKQFKNRKHKTLKKFNKDLKEIGALARISKPITSYVARHTYATILKFKKVSIEAISELMGHSDIRVTKSYLKDFNDELLDEISRNILEDGINIYQNIA